MEVAGCHGLIFLALAYFSFQQDDIKKPVSKETGFETFSLFCAITSYLVKPLCGFHTVFG